MLQKKGQLKRKENEGFEGRRQRHPCQIGVTLASLPSFKKKKKSYRGLRTLFHDAQAKRDDSVQLPSARNFSVKSSYFYYNYY